MAKVSASIQAETDALVGCQVEIVVSLPFSPVVLLQSPMPSYGYPTATFIITGYSGLCESSFYQEPDTK